MFPPSTRQVLPLPLDIRRIGQASDTSQFHRSRFFLLFQRSAGRTGLLRIDGLRLRAVQRFVLRKSGQSALFTHDDESAVGLKLPPYRIAYNHLPPAQSTRAIPCVIMPGAKTIIGVDPQRADDWLSHFQVV